MRTLVAAAILLGKTAVGDATAGQGVVPRAQPDLPTACRAPYSPSWSAVGEWDELDVPWSGSELAFVPPPLDTDGDGTADTVEQLDAGVEITRGSGVLQIGEVALTNGAAPADIDGDGRSDMVLSTLDDSTRSFIVLGSLPDGSYEAVAPIGIAMPDLLLRGENVGDHDGDGVDDLRFSNLGSTVGYQEIHSGAAIAAVPAGGAYDDPPLFGVGGTTVGRVAFTPERADLLVSAAAPFAYTPDTDVDLTLHGDTVVEMVVPADGAVPWPSGGQNDRDSARAFADGDRTWIVWSVVGLDDDQRRTWVWELTDLCLRPTPPTTDPPTTTTPGAPPARPVAAPAAFTG